MIMRQRKRVETENDMEKDKPKLNVRLLLPEMIVLCAAIAGTGIVEWINQTEFDRVLSHMVLILLGLAMAGYAFRNAYLHGTLSYRNAEHTLRYWICVGIGLAISFACVFLPAGGYPFLAVFVMLTLFGNATVGIATSAILVMIPILISGESVGVFVLYLVSGIFAALLFDGIETEIRIVVPLFLSELTLLVCETAQVVLLTNERLSLELFVIPVVNMVVSAILLLSVLKMFSVLVIYQYRESYLELNDTENPILKECKQENREIYFCGIHTVYFCERIAARLSLDVDALKCAGYYHGMGEKLSALMKENKFPPHAAELLLEYQNRKRGVLHKETAVLIYAEAIVNSFTYLFQKDEDKHPGYEQIIDAVFKKVQDSGMLRECNITMQELTLLRKIFKEEKLYYDFLR